MACSHVYRRDCSLELAMTGHPLEAVLVPQMTRQRAAALVLAAAHVARVLRRTTLCTTQHHVTSVLRRTIMYTTHHCVTTKVTKQ